jgi:hypothetical protein
MLGSSFIVDRMRRGCECGQKDGLRGQAGHTLMRPRQQGGAEVQFFIFIVQVQLYSTLNEINRSFCCK